MKFPFLLLMLLILAACGNDQQSAIDQDNNSQNVEVSKQQIDSLKTLYQTSLTKREDWFPAKFIAEAGKLNPVDEALSDTAFFVFRETLLEAVRKKDVFYLLENTDQFVKYSFGEDGGLAGFVEQWELDSPEGIQRSEVWKYLEAVLMMGGNFSDGGKTFTAPYYFALFPDQYDAFTHGVVTGRGVRMRSAPNLRAPIVKNLSYDIVEILGETAFLETIGGEEHPWVQVKITEDKEGYIWGKYIGRAIGFRAGFSKQPDGSWLMHFFVTGD
jgi:hypothetical protein